MSLNKFKKKIKQKIKINSAGDGWAGLGWAGLGWAGLGWAGLGLAELQNHATVSKMMLKLSCGVGFGDPGSPELRRELRFWMKLLTVWWFWRCDLQKVCNCQQNDVEIELWLEFWGTLDRQNSSES